MGEVVKIYKGLGCSRIATNGWVLLQAGNSLLCPTPTADE